MWVPGDLKKLVREKWGGCRPPRPALSVPRPRSPYPIYFGAKSRRESPAISCSHRADTPNRFILKRHPLHFVLCPGNCARIRGPWIRSMESSTLCRLPFIGRGLISGARVVCPLAPLWQQPTRRHMEVRVHQMSNNGYKMDGHGTPPQPEPS